MEFDPMTEVGFVRLYNKKGEHILSVVPCDEDGADLCKPDGECLYCGIPYDLLRIMMDYMGKDTDLK